jgi:hypothetical protein
MRRRALCVATLLLCCAAAPAAAGAAPWIGVRGNHLVDRQGRTVRLLGVNRSSADYECVEGGEHVFAGPTDAASIEAMKSWHINAVRIPLNEDCWLGINGVPSDLGGSAYRAAIREYVEALEGAGLYVILDLHWAAPDHDLATGLIPLPDADHTPEFWTSLATEYREDHGVIFDVYNEPHDVTWDCWAGPCITFDPWVGWYRSVGLPELLAAVRATGATQPVMLGGLNWSQDLRGWLKRVPADPAQAIIAANHTYDVNDCYGDCRTALVRIARKYPVVTGELGEMDCGHAYIDQYMRWADRHSISYLAWAWNAGEGWTCQGGPSLIEDFTGAPTPFGIGFREHLRRLTGVQPGATLRAPG